MLKRNLFNWLVACDRMKLGELFPIASMRHPSRDAWGMWFKREGEHTFVEVTCLEVLQNNLDVSVLDPLLEAGMRGGYMYGYDQLQVYQGTIPLRGNVQPHGGMVTLAPEQVREYMDRTWEQIQRLPKGSLGGMPLQVPKSFKDAMIARIDDRITSMEESITASGYFMPKSVEKALTEKDKAQVEALAAEANAEAKGPTPADVMKHNRALRSQLRMLVNEEVQAHLLGAKIMKLQASPGGGFLEVQVAGSNEVFSIPGHKLNLAGLTVETAIDVMGGTRQ